MTTESKSLNSFIALVLALTIADPLRWLMAAGTLSLLWDWFFVGFLPLPPPSMRVLFGFVAIVALLRARRWQEIMRDLDEDVSALTDMTISFLWTAFMCVVILAVAYVSKSIAGWN